MTRSRLARTKVVLLSMAALAADGGFGSAHGQSDPLGRIFRRRMIEVAAAARIPRLDSLTLASRVRREIRVYTGFGFGVPHRMVRLWEDDGGVHGRYGVFWPTNENTFSYASPDEEERGRADTRRLDRLVRANVDSMYGCASPGRSIDMNVCWLPDNATLDDWPALLARFDSVGVNSVSSPVQRRTGHDGWTVVVEVWAAGRYRSYRGWQPTHDAADPNERAVAFIGTTVDEGILQRMRP